MRPGFGLLSITNNGSSRGMATGPLQRSGTNFLRWLRQLEYVHEMSREPGAVQRNSPPPDLHVPKTQWHSSMTANSALPRDSESRIARSSDAPTGSRPHNPPLLSPTPLPPALLTPSRPPVVLPPRGSR